MYILAFMLVFPFQVFADVQISEHPIAYQLEEMRYCGEPPRYESGAIKRSTAMITAFKKAHPCPSTGLTTGSCPGWAIDHVIPLACGGCDSVSNAQWLPNTIKSGADADNKDRWERKIYCLPFVMP